MSEDEAKGQRKGRGFASMSAERRREISRLGGKSVPKDKRSFAQNRDLASAAGRKGGQGVPNEKRSFTQNRSLAVEAGRKGGRSVSKSKAEAAQAETPDVPEDANGSISSSYGIAKGNSSPDRV